jgi:hypothetical protein
LEESGGKRSRARRSTPDGNAEQMKPQAPHHKVYYGTASKVYTASVPAGSATSVTVSNLTAGVTCYFAATAVDSSGAEGTYSQEIVYAPALVPTTSPARLQLGVLGNRQAVLSRTAPAGYTYNVLASSTLASWAIIGSVTADANGNLHFTDPSPATNKVRSYRLQQVSP